MEAAETTLPSGLSVEELLDWRPDLGVVTVCVAIDPADRGEGWLTELRSKLRAAVAARDDGHDRGRALTATAERTSPASMARSCPPVATTSASAR
jgi:hypothetical protein